MWAGQQGGVLRAAVTGEPGAPTADPGAADAPGGALLIAEGPRATTFSAEPATPGPARNL